MHTFEVTIIKRQTDAVQPQALEKCCILVLEEIFEELNTTSESVNGAKPKPDEPCRRKTLTSPPQ